MQGCNFSAQHAFSLVELSIVLVILGLLTGGILSGQSLIRAAELRAISTEFQMYSTAVSTFRDKYMAIAGDFKDATKFWGRDDAVCATDTGTTATPGTCNGNGDGIIGHPSNNSAMGEGFQTWKQLALAGLIEGSYTGVEGSGGLADSDAGINVPASKMKNACWNATYLQNSGGSNGYAFAYNYRNAMLVGADDNAFCDAAVLKPEEAWNIDTKMDDGKPGIGKMTSNRACSTAATNTEYTADYNFALTANMCAMTMRYLN